MIDYDLKTDKNIKRNENFIKLFEKSLKEEKLSERTINKHLDNIDLFINDYLNHYDTYKMEEGPYHFYDLFSYWFPIKIAYSSETLLKSLLTTVKKFYKCMVENNLVDKEMYDYAISSVNQNFDEFIDILHQYK